MSPRFSALNGSEISYIHSLVDLHVDDGTRRSGLVARTRAKQSVLRSGRFLASQIEPVNRMFGVGSEGPSFTVPDLFSWRALFEGWVCPFTGGRVWSLGRDWWERSRRFENVGVEKRVVVEVEFKRLGYHLLLVFLEKEVENGIRVYEVRRLMIDAKFINDKPLSQKIQCTKLEI